jgi:hypothetical protein
MTVTFLVAVNLSDLTTLADVAADIEDDLASAGHDVVSVKPWTRPTAQTPAANPFASLPSLIEPTTQTQQPNQT